MGKVKILQIELADATEEINKLEGLCLHLEAWAGYENSGCAEKEHLAHLKAIRVRRDE